MKKLHQYMMILVAGVLGACGSMSVSDPYAEALPADFNAQEYLSLHPQLEKTIRTRCARHWLSNTSTPHETI